MSSAGAAPESSSTLQGRLPAVPGSYACPITTEVMEDPVMAADGFTYEREAISSWIRCKGTSPKTGQTMPHGNLYPNHEKRAAIAEWKSKYEGPHTAQQTQLANSSTKIAWASSSSEAVQELERLGTMVIQTCTVVPPQQLARMRVCLKADESIWCTEVERAVENVESHCRSVSGMLNQRMQKAQMTAERAAKTGKEMAAGVIDLQTELNSAQQQVNMLKQRLAQAGEGPRKMWCMEQMYSREAEKMRDSLVSAGWPMEDLMAASNDNKRPVEAEQADQEHETAKRAKTSQTDLSSDHVMEQALMLDHDCGHERVLTELAAELGNQVAKARCQLSGWAGFKSDSAEAFRLLEPIAKDTPVGQCCLAECYEYGLGTQQDPSQAVLWYTTAADQGLPRAQCSLGACYRDGIGVDVDFPRAAELFCKAAQQGHARAQCCMAKCFELGRGMEQSHIKALQWYHLAAQQGHPWGQCWLGTACHRGLGMPVSRPAAEQWFKKSAEQGDPQALCCLGEYCEHGLVGQVDKQKALMYYMKSAKKGHPRAQHHLRQHMKRMQAAKAQQGTPQGNPPQGQRSTPPRAPAPAQWPKCQ